MSKALDNVNVELLKQQKETLVDLINRVELEDMLHYQFICDLDGIVNLLDAIQDELEPLD